MKKIEKENLENVGGGYIKQGFEKGREYIKVFDNKTKDVLLDLKLTGDKEDDRSLIKFAQDFDRDSNS